MGKITNLLAADFSALEQRLIYLMYGTQLPLVLLGISIILVIRMGWISLAGLVVVALFFPVSRLISQFNGGILREVTQQKDDRVRSTTELIEAIKYIKLYGWEQTFKRMINGIRKTEFEFLRSIVVGRSSEKSLSVSLPLIGTFVTLSAAWFGGATFG